MGSRGVFRTLEGGLYAFYCPGCKCYHGLDKRWTIEGIDTETPTVYPSIVTSGPQCHLWIKNGEIEYLHDCRHELAGKTVKMEPEE